MLRIETVQDHTDLCVKPSRRRTVAVTVVLTDSANAPAMPYRYAGLVESYVRLLVNHDPRSELRVVSATEEVL